jgi:3-oxoacyl-[acyl-carrier-protein] synthase II
VQTSDAIWITGVGAATSLGNSYRVVADNLLAGRSGVRAITRFDADRHRCKIGALIGELPTPLGWDPAQFSQMTRFEQLLVWCIAGALQDAGWWEGRGNKRIGIVLGLGAEWAPAWEVDWQQGGNRVRNPQEESESVVNIVQRRLGLSGPVNMLAAACASGNHALAEGRRWLRQGWVDACVAGACALDVTPVSLACFGNIGALARRSDNPEAASRPFDRGRDGFVMGDGGAMFLLEPATSARRRGSRVYGELAGFGASSDAFHMVTPGNDPEPASRAVGSALADAGLNPGEIDYVNAHATSTPMGDRCESRVLHLALGEAARTVPVSSTKSMTGHLLSASAAVEALACLAAIERQALPPTINLDDPDPECDLCHVANEARPAQVRAVISNSFGFGGCNTSLVLKKVA